MQLWEDFCIVTAVHPRSGNWYIFFLLQVILEQLFSAIIMPIHSGYVSRDRVVGIWAVSSYKNIIGQYSVVHVSITMRSHICFEAFSTFFLEKILDYLWS